MGQQVPTPHTLCCHTASTRPSLNGESPAQPANLKQSSPEPPRSQGPASPQQLRRLLRGSLRPSSYRELELLQPLGGSTSFAPFWIRFKAVLHTSWPRRWLPRGSWPGPYRLGGRPERGDEPRSAGPGRGRQTDPGSLPPVPSRRRAYLGLSHGGLLCVDLVVFQLAFGGDREPRALIWMTDRINSDSFAPIPGA